LKEKKKKTNDLDFYRFENITKRGVMTYKTHIPDPKEHNVVNDKEKYGIYGSTCKCPGGAKFSVAVKGKNGDCSSGFACFGGIPGSVESCNESEG